MKELNAHDSKVGSFRRRQRKGEKWPGQTWIFVKNTKRTEQTRKEGNIVIPLVVGVLEKLKH